MTEGFLPNADVGVLLLSPNTSGCHGLRKLAEKQKDMRVSEAFAGTQTVAAALTNKKLFERARGGLILVDEAGLMGARDMCEVFRAAQVVDARILLIGDTKQHHAVPAGDALRILKSYAGLNARRS